MKHLLLLFSLFFLLPAYSQPLQQSIDFNHIYFVVDDATYDHLFDDPFIKDSLFLAHESTSSGEDGSWTGKYLMGKHDYLELFKRSSFEGAQVGVLGIGFLLTAPADLEELQSDWQLISDAPIIIQNFITEQQGKKDTIWNEIMDQRDSIEDGRGAALFVLSYHIPELRRMGFSDQKIGDRISSEDLYDMLTARRKYSKAFDRITKIYLTLTPAEYSRHTKALELFGYTRSGKWYTKDISFHIRKRSKVQNRVRKVRFQLNRPMKRKIIRVAPRLLLKLKNKSGILIVN